MRLSIGLAVVFLTGMFFSIMAWYLDLPTVGLNDRHECQWVEEAPAFERRDCPKELPDSYHPVYVHYDDSKGE